MFILSQFTNVTSKTKYNINTRTMATLKNSL